MDKYLTYAEYQTYGGTLSESAFNKAEYRAQKHIDYLTDTRVAAMAAVPEEVKMCLMSLINLYNERILWTEKMDLYEGSESLLSLSVVYF